jgi:hypothetical protein
MIGQKEFINFLQTMSLKTLEELQSYINVLIENKFITARKLLEGITNKQNDKH